MKGHFRDAASGAMAKDMQPCNLSKSPQRNRLKTSAILSSALFPLTTSSNASLNIFSFISQVSTDIPFSVPQSGLRHCNLEIRNHILVRRYVLEANHFYQNPWDLNALGLRLPKDNHQLIHNPRGYAIINTLNVLSKNLARRWKTYLDWDLPEKPQ
jgi:hypothetical protein